LRHLKRTGSFTHHYVELGSPDELVKDGVGVLRVEGREMMNVILNDRLVSLPVIKTRGVMKYWIRGELLDVDDTVIVLDDERFPLLIDQHGTNEKAASRIYFSKITHAGGRQPGGGTLSMRPGFLEEGLVDDKRVDVYGIYFDFNSDRIRPESEPVLEEIGSIMKRRPDWRLSIQGHTDNVGGNGAYNLELSKKRSAAVVSALVNRFGISAGRLTSGGSGAAAPKDTNDTPEGRARNRRVELVRY
jgi:outer membrane protein OmpA-like peptidoglycan-associated protein